MMLIDMRIALAMRVLGMSDALHMGLESVVVIGVVGHHPVGSVGFIDRVRSNHNVSVPVLPLALVITSVRIHYSIFELVLRVGIVVVVVFLMLLNYVVFRRYCHKD